MDVAELQTTVTSLGAAVGVVGLLASKSPDDKELADVLMDVTNAHQQLCGRLQTMLTERHLADLKARTVAELQAPRDLDWERARR